MKKTIITILVIVLTLVPVIGCKSGKSDQGASSTEPVTLTIYKSGLSLTETEFQTFFVEPVKKKYPHITLKLVADEPGSKPEELIAAGTFPDIIFTSSPSYFQFKKLNIINDLNGLVKENHFDLSRIKPILTDSVKLFSDKNELIALPFSFNVSALFYNKDIFDQAGEQYPQDLMTWDDALKLARKLTRTEGGVKYVGIDLGEPAHVGRSLSLDYIDPKTNKGAVTTDSWVKVFQLLKDSYSIPGYIGENNKYVYGTKAFLEEKNVAMLPYWLGGMIGPLEELHKKGTPLNFDIAPVPNFKEELGKGKEVDIHSMILSNQSKHKEQAFQVMSLMLTDEVQRIISRSGRVPVLNNPQLEKEFGQDLASLKGKHIENIFKTQPVKIHTPSEFDKGVAIKRLSEAAKSVAVDSADVNTALRTAQENINKDIESLIKTDGAGSK